MKRYYRDLVPWLMVAGVQISACSNSEVAGMATSQPAGSTQAAAASFAPCTDLTGADIVSFGLDPGSKQDVTREIGGIAHGCQWENADIIAGFTVGPGSLDALLGSTRFPSIARIQVQGRDAARVIIDPSPGNCAIAIPSGGSVVGVTVGVKYRALQTAGNPCTLVTDLASKVVTKIPR